MAFGMYQISGLYQFLFGKGEDPHTQPNVRHTRDVIVKTLIYCSMLYAKWQSYVQNDNILGKNVIFFKYEAFDKSRQPYLV